MQVSAYQSLDIVCECLADAGTASGPRSKLRRERQPQAQLGDGPVRHIRLSTYLLPDNENTRLQCEFTCLRPPKLAILLSFLVLLLKASRLIPRGSCLVNRREGRDQPIEERRTDEGCVWRSKAISTGD